MGRGRGRRVRLGYRTREAAHYLEALRGEKTCNTILRPVAETMETARPVALVQNVLDTNSDCFDRTQIYGYSPGEIILPSEEVAASLQKVKWHSLNSRKQPIMRLQKRAND